MNIGEKMLKKLQKEISQNDYERYIKKLHYDMNKSGGYSCSICRCKYINI